MAKRTQPPEISQTIEDLIDRGAEMHRGTRKKLREQAGDRPYKARKLSPDEELSRYRTEIRSNPEAVLEFIQSERTRLGLSGTKLDGSPLIPRSAITELKRLEARHRGKPEE